jgi:hypothetical protein
MLGSAGTILQELGLVPEGSGSYATVPRLNLGLDLSGGPSYTLGLDFSLSWLSTSVSSGAYQPVQYATSRVLVPLDAMGRFSVGSPSFSFFTAFGPSLGVTRFEEQGWLGDGSALSPTVGMVLRAGFRISPIPRLRLVAGFHFQEHLLTRNNPLIEDGGWAQSTGVFAGIDLAPWALPHEAPPTGGRGR